MKKIIVLILIGYPLFTYGQNEEWIARYKLHWGDGQPSAMAVDNSGNVYVVGSSNKDFLTIKYNSSGDTVWVRTYNGNSNGLDITTGVAIGELGNIYVTGWSDDSITGSDYLTIKYNSLGNMLWFQRYTSIGKNYDEPSAIASDKTGNVYVTGRVHDNLGNYDYATVKYNSAGGTMWVKTYENMFNGRDIAYDIAVDNSSNIYVTGESDGSGWMSDYATIKYDSSGNELWVKRYNRYADTPEEARAIAVDSKGNVYVTGWGEGVFSTDYVTIKYNTAGDTMWLRRYEGEEAKAIAVDNKGNVYVTGGRGFYSIEDYETIKYDSLGNLIWVRTYNGGGNGQDDPVGIVVDSFGNAYVTGSSLASNNDFVYLTIKYTDYGTDWIRCYSGGAGVINTASAIAIDGAGNVYVTGQSGYDYVTIKYAGEGIEESKELRVESTELRVIRNKIYLSVEDARDVELKVYDLCGRERETVYEGVLNKGSYEFGTGVRAMGVYFIKLKAGDYEESRKIVLIR